MPRLNPEQLAERHKPLLVLYPEIAGPERKVPQDWKKRGIPPLSHDYHPRDVNLVLDHAAPAHSAFLRGRGPSEHNREGLLAAMQGRELESIDILVGVGHADRDRFWEQYYSIVSKRPPHDADETYAHRAYVHVVRGDDVVVLDEEGREQRPYRGLIAIEYWMLYIYNDWKAVHEGDWELVVVFLEETPEGEGRPVGCAYSAHHGGYRLSWDCVETVDDAGSRAAGGPHPVVYVANGSHANYFYGPGRYWTSAEALGVRITGGEFPFTGSFIDYTASFDEGERVFPDVAVVPAAASQEWSGVWRWLNFAGGWGAQLPKWVATGLRLIPRWLRFRLTRIWGPPASLPQRVNWHNPFAWADIECEEAPVPDSWLAFLRSTPPA